MPEPCSSAPPPTLYAVLGEDASGRGQHGETRKTSAKETIDDDREAFDAVSLLGDH